jgi:hypothetical protein
MLTSTFNQFINPWALEAIGWWYYLAYCAWLIVELVFVIWFVVETKGMFFFWQLPRTFTYTKLQCAPTGRTLEETAAIFEDEYQQQDLMIMGGEAATMSMSRGVVGVNEGDPDHSKGRLDSPTRKEYPQHYELQNRLRRFSGDGDSAVIKSFH